MFEVETEHIIAAVKQRVPPSGTNHTSVAVKDILAADIPYPLKTFFRADVEAMLNEEFHQHRKASRFNFDHPEAVSLQNQLNSFLVLHFCYQREEFQKRLGNAVHLMINYLIRPQWTLTGVIFEKEETVSSLTVIRSLRFFGPYEYLKEILSRYLRDKTIATLSQRAFRVLLRKIDGEYIRRKAGDEISRIATPIFEFLDFPRNSGLKALPVRGLMKYFEDKGMIGVLHRLEGEAAQGKQDLMQRELGDLLEEVRRLNGAFEIESVEEQAAVTQPAIPVSTPVQSILKPAAGALKSASAGKEQATPIPEIGEGEKRRFIKKIFRQDEDAFNAALRAMTDFASWKETSVFIDEIYIQYEVDPYSSEAKRFIEIMSQRFYPKK